jgi:ubiquinone/menaquinone biosynthesis C-methylase UbiE
MKAYEEKENYITVRPEPYLWRDHANYKIIQYSRELFKDAYVADLGCNHGACTLLVHDFDPLRIDGFDMNEDALKVARQTSIDLNVQDKSQFICSSLLDIPIEDGHYDVVCSFHTLEHIYPNDANMVVKEMFRILKPSGHVLLSIPYKHNYPDPCHVAFYDEHSLKTLFETHGFLTTYCIEDNRWQEQGLLTALFQKPYDAGDDTR